MPRIVLIGPDGVEHSLEASPGQSIMEAAVKSGVPGIVAECGGACNCATCHVYIDDAFVSLVGPAGEWEAEMLEDAASPPTPASRLSCQVRVSDALVGLRVRIAPEQ